MKIKTSVTLSEDLLSVIDRQASKSKSRSDFIESALWVYLKSLGRLEQNQRDLNIINQSANQLNSEAGDVLDFQTLK